MNTHLDVLDLSYYWYVSKHENSGKEGENGDCEMKRHLRLNTGVIDNLAAYYIK